MSRKSNPRGVRNNNPLNIRYVKKNKWQGRVLHKVDNDFEEFANMTFGYRAAFMLLHKYMNLYNLRCIYDVVARWAPNSDGNDVFSYASQVSDKTGIQMFAQIDWRDWGFMTRMAVAMAEVENGISMSYVPSLMGYISAAKTLGYDSIALEAQEYYNSIIALS